MSSAAVVDAPHEGGLGARVRFLHIVIDRVSESVRGDDGSPVTGGDVAEVERAIRRLEAVKLSLVARAERERLPQRSGSSSTASWLSTTTASGSSAAAGQVALAAALDHDLPATQAALGEGTVSVAGARVIAGAMESLPDSLSEAERARVERALVQDARRLEPGRLRRRALLAVADAGRSAQEAADHAERVVADQERTAYAAARLTLHDHGDGTTSGRFVVPTTAAAMLRKVVQSMCAPRREETRRAAFGPRSEGAGERAEGFGGASDGAAGAGNAADGVATRAGEQCDDAAAAMRARNHDWDSLDWAGKAGRALVEILEHLPTEGLTGSVAATIVVTMTLDQAMGAAARASTGATSGPTGGVARSDVGAVLSASDARRLACQAGVLPAVLGGSSLPLDLGRSARLYRPHQRVALATVYDACAALGCDRPYSWTELHHEHAWSNGGKTDLRDAVPLCGFHHRRIHDPMYASRVLTDARGKKSVSLVQRT